MLNNQLKRQRRHKSIRAKIKGTDKKPRFCVFRSNQHIYGQLIDDQKGKTILAIKGSDIKKKGLKKMELAKEAGKLLAEQAVQKKITKAVFDRGGYKYHGRVKAMAEGAREGGLEF